MNNTLMKNNCKDFLDYLMNHSKTMNFYFYQTELSEILKESFDIDNFQELILDAIDFKFATVKRASEYIKENDPNFTQCFDIANRLGYETTDILLLAELLCRELTNIALQDDLLFLDTEYELAKKYQDNHN